MVSSAAGQGARDIVAILGGEFLLLYETEDWPLCPACQGPLVPILHLPLFAERHPPEFIDLFSGNEKSAQNLTLQFLACSDTECFETTTIQDDCAWLLRTVSASASDVVWVGPGDFSPLGGRASDLDANMQDWKDVHLRLAEGEDSGNLFKPLYILTGWREGKLEMVHAEDHTDLPDVSDYLYNEHEPVEGVKLLGYPVKGKFKCGSWGNGCPRDEEDCKWRCIIQLGSLHDQEFDLLDTSGNCWIMHCEKHPDQFAVGLSGDW
ncbi:hypothetical protein LshimejAT787_1801180 [Lyophyllum shimeji]|uniref:Uncharacterized protein n=1 Tax=Lyophyllum shimeji TaxID=47721 RepID=A0A9P3Q025_LYOSH|nr:hypothetical protein LshimejAT787_1801180 [Lyophyllum shimeji]